MALAREQHIEVYRVIGRVRMMQLPPYTIREWYKSLFGAMHPTENFKRSLNSEPDMGVVRAINLSYVKVQVLYFAQAREFAGTKEDEFVLTSPSSVKDLLSQMVNTHPELGEIIGILRPLVNGRMVTDDAELKEGDRVAIVPPVGGG